ncbi:hypothetical protein KGY79_10725 [Candidatus Bipolaricaulota bacterium]|nr:hypothetical protein [Candidatus Bipolaricaulota bacterium]
MPDSHHLPLEDPNPDVEEFESVVLGEKPPERVHFAELLFDEEPMKYITEKYLGRDWIFPSNADHFNSMKSYLDPN